MSKRPGRPGRRSFAYPTLRASFAPLPEDLTGSRPCLQPLSSVPRHVFGPNSEDERSVSGLSSRPVSGVPQNVLAVKPWKLPVLVSFTGWPFIDADISFRSVN